MSRRHLVARAAAVAALAVVTLAGATLAASPKPSLTITKPTPGQSISKAAGSFAVEGATNFTVPAPTTTKLYMRRDEGGSTCTGAMYLDDAKGADSGCQFLAGSATLAGDSFADSYPVDPEKVPMPLTIDASRNITGALIIKTTPVGVANHIQMDATVTIGEWSASQSFDTGVYQGATKQLDVNLDIPDELDKVDAQDLSLSLNWRRMIHVLGVYNTTLSQGSSSLNVPTYSASFARSVEVSLDDPTFLAPEPAQVDLVARTFHLDYPTAFLSLGNHIVYARAIQGGVNSTTRFVAFSVTA